MSRQQRRPRQWPLITLTVLVVSLVFLATSDNPRIWALRNTLSYRLTKWWTANYGSPQPTPTASMQGCVYDAHNTPVPGATVLLSERDGTLHRVMSDADGCYELAGAPPGRYVPLADAPGHAPATVRPWGLPLSLTPEARLQLDFTLPTVSLPAVPPATDLHLGAPISVTHSIPRPATAVRRQIRYTSGGKPNQLTFLYTPVEPVRPLPVLLAVYPGQADWWELVSIALADAGYAVIASGPAYALDLEADVDELQQLVALVRAGKLPHADGQRIALLSGSYSSLHTYRLLQRDTGFRGAIILGGASDLFDLRQRFEAGTFSPPLGLDRAFIALGMPNTVPERYWRYSARYQLRADTPPLAVLHSRDDEVIPYQQSESLVHELERLQIPHEAHFFDGLPHYFFTEQATPRLLQLYELTLDFLQRRLG